MLQLREKLKCLTPMGQRVLAKINGTNGRDFCYGDSVIVLCLSLQRWLLLSGNKNNIYVGCKQYNILLILLGEERWAWLEMEPYRWPSLKAYGTEPNPGIHSGFTKGDGAKRDPFFLFVSFRGGLPQVLPPSVKQRGNLGLMHIPAIGHICHAGPKLVSGSLKEGGGDKQGRLAGNTLCSFTCSVSFS